TCSRHLSSHHLSYRLFSFNATATPHIYTLSLHDALPISHELSELLGETEFSERLTRRRGTIRAIEERILRRQMFTVAALKVSLRSEEHTSELQSRFDLVCRLLLEKKKNRNTRSSLVTQHL